MVRTGASVGHEPLFSTVAYVALQTNVARSAFSFYCNISVPTFSSTKFALGKLFVTNVF